MKLGVPSFLDLKIEAFQSHFYSYKSCGKRKVMTNNKILAQNLENLTKKLSSKFTAVTVMNS